LGGREERKREELTHSAELGNEGGDFVHDAQGGWQWGGGGWYRERKVDIPVTGAERVSVSGGGAYEGPGGGYVLPSDTWMGTLTGIERQSQCSRSKGDTQTAEPLMAFAQTCASGTTDRGAGRKQWAHRGHTLKHHT
jgi:hypothetical protein